MVPLRVQVATGQHACWGDHIIIDGNISVKRSFFSLLDTISLTT